MVLDKVCVKARKQDARDSLGECYLRVDKMGVKTT